MLLFTVSIACKHLTNTLCDRVVQRLQEILEIELLELKCNIHPLDGVAKKSSNILHIYDENITSDTFGRKCCAVNFIIAINKMRYKQCKGNPSGFKLFWRQDNIKSSIIVHNVGNHYVPPSWCVVLFNGKVFDVLDTRLSKQNKFKDIPTKRFKLSLQLRALGIIGKLVTGPRMHQ